MRGRLCQLCVLSLLQACSAPSILLDSADRRSPWGEEEGDDERDDSGQGGKKEADDTAGTEQVGDNPNEHSSDWIFGLDQLHSVDLTISDEAYNALSSDPYTYVEGTLVFDGTSYDSIGLRIKGRIGSYRSLSQKSAFKIDFNEFISGQTMDGLEKLNLNNMVQDGAFTHERIAYALWNEMDVPAPRVGYAWVTLNGSDYGIYTLVDVYDDVFLERHYQDASGNLYDGDYYMYDSGSYTMLDFHSSLHDMFELDEGQDVGRADIHAVTEALWSVAGTDQYYDVVGALVDLDELVRMWAVEVWVGHYDSYTYNRNNYRVYFDPGDGLADLFPWDPDWAFYSSTPITSPSGYLTTYCKSDPVCHEEFYDALELTCMTADSMGLEEQLDQAIALIDPYLDADPRKETATSTIRSNQEAHRTWLRTRTATLEATGGL